MRRYKLVIAGEVIETTDNNPHALQVRFDLSTMSSYLASFQTIEIEGIVPKWWDNSKNLSGQSIQLYAGMAAGLPLANKDQYGLIFSGSIERAYKIVQGPNAKLVIMARMASVADPLQGFTIKSGDDIAKAAKSAMETAGIAVTLDNGATATATRDIVMAPADVASFAVMLKEYKLHLSASPSGMRISSLESGSADLKKRKIDYFDIIGQPTGTEETYVVFQTAMRADIVPSQLIQLPVQTTPLYINPPGALFDLQPFLSQTGDYLVLEVRHMGDFRNTVSAESWVTQYTCVRPT